MLDAYVSYIEYQVSSIQHQIDSSTNVKLNDRNFCEIKNKFLTLHPFFDGKD